MRSKQPNSLHEFVWHQLVGMRSLIQKVLSESIIIYIKNSNHNTNLKEIKKGYCEKCRTNKKKGHNKMTKQEQQNGIVHASYSELQLEELETITAARVAMTAARAAHGCPEDGHWEIRTGRLALLHNSVPMRVGRRRGVKH